MVPMDRTATMAEVHPYEGRVYAQPLAGLRISWGSLLAGTLALVASATILWALCLAIILTATNANWGSISGSLIAMWICAMITTVVAGIVGGWVAGYLPGNRSTGIGVLHGFLAWALAFLAMTAIYFTTIGNATVVATNTTVSAASATVQAAGSAAGGVAGGQPDLDRKATVVLESLGYSPAESSSMVSSAKSAIQKVLRGRVSAQSTTASLFDPVIAWAAGLSWSWWGTWLATMGTAMIGGYLGAKQLQRKGREVEEEEAKPLPAVRETPTPAMPLTPHPQAT